MTKIRNLLIALALLFLSVTYLPVVASAHPDGGPDQYFSGYLHDWTTNQVEGVTRTYRCAVGAGDSGIVSDTGYWWAYVEAGRCWKWVNGWVETDLVRANAYVGVIYTPEWYWKSYPVLLSPFQRFTWSDTFNPVWHDSAVTTWARICKTSAPTTCGDHTWLTT